MGVKIVKNDFAKRLDRLNDMPKNGVDKSVLKKMQIQWLGNNLKRYTREEYADNQERVRKWKPFKQDTLYRINKKGEKKWKKRRGSDGSVGRYSASSKLLMKSGILRGSANVLGHPQSTQEIKSYYIQIGSKLKQALYQHKMRPIVSISFKDRSMFERIMVKYLKGEKI